MNVDGDTSLMLFSFFEVQLSIWGKQQVHFIVDCLQTFDLDPRAFSTKSVAVIILGNGYED